MPHSRKTKAKASRKTKAKSTTLYLPDDCWENVVKFLVNDQLSLESLSLVSKQLLSITNRFKFSLTIFDQTLNPNYITRLFHRFPNITSLNLTRFGTLDSSRNFDRLLCQISDYPVLHIESLNLSNHCRIPSKGFKALSKKLKTSLKSIVCSNIGSLNHNDLTLIGNCFPFLEELDLTNHNHNAIDKYFIRVFHNNPYISEYNRGIEALSLALPYLRKLNLSYNNDIRDSSLLHLFKNCVFLEEVVMFSRKSLTSDGIASAIRERPNLKSFMVDNYFMERMYIANSQFINSLVSLEDLNCLDLSLTQISDGLLSSITKEVLPWRKLVLKSCYGFTYDGIFSLLCKCQFLQHLNLQYVSFLNDQHVVDLSLILGKLVYIDVSGCYEVTDSAMFALVRNCPLLGEIRMESTGIGKCNVVKDLDSVNPHHRVKSLHLGSNSWLKDESIKFFASIFPNLELLDLSRCSGISDQGVVEVLRICLKIRHLTLKSNPRVRLLGMKFHVPKLEVLSMSNSSIDDETLSVISKSCSGLLELELEHCDVTQIGVRLVIENCTKLRKINLFNCRIVAANVFNWMVNSRPSLRKIVAPRHFHPSDREEKLFSEHGCLIGYGLV